MAFYFHIFISVALALTAVVQETRGYTTSNPTNGSATIRLIPGTSASTYYDDNPRGLIEVKVGDEWGPICGVFEFDYDEAKVACRQLGYSYSGYYGYAQDTFDIDTQYDVAFYIGLSCSGYEDSLTECKYGVLRGSADACVSGLSGRGYAGVVCDNNVVTTSAEYSVGFNYFGWLVLVAIFFTIFMVIRRYRQRGGCCNNRDQTVQHTAVHTTNNVQGVVIPPPSGGSYPPPPPGTYPSQPQANYQYQPVPQYNTGLPPKEGAPPYQAQNPYPQGAPYPQGGAPYPPQGAGAPYPPQGAAPYPPQVVAAGAPYPPQAAGAPYPPQGGAPYPPQATVGAPYPPQNAGAPYQSQYQGASAPPQGSAPTSEASAPASNPAFPPAEYVPEANTDYTLSTAGWHPTAN